MAGVALTRGLRSYRELLAQPNVREVVAWGLIARAPIGMVALAQVLLVRGSGGTYADAGIVTAAGSLALAVCAPIGGRLIDRRRPAMVLATYGVIHPAALFALVGLALAHAPLPLLAAASAAAGATEPPIGPTVRTLWSRLVTPEHHAAAFAMEATLQELFFVAGPLLVGVLTVLITSSAGVVGAAVIGAVGITGLATRGPVRSLHPDGGPHDQHPLAALGPSLVRRIVIFTFFYGIAFGAVEVAMPAFGEEHGGRSLGAVSVSAWSAGSLAGGLIAAAPAAGDALRRLRIVSAVFGLALGLPLLAGSVPVMAVIMFVTGAPIAPSFALTYGMVQRAATHGTQAEVFAWLTTAVVVGVAVGTGVGGSLITHSGPHASLLLGMGGGLLAAAVAALPGSEA